MLVYALLVSDQISLILQGRKNKIYILKEDGRQRKRERERDREGQREAEGDKMRQNETERVFTTFWCRKDNWDRDKNTVNHKDGQ